MEDVRKTKKQLIEELQELRQSVTELKGFEEEVKQTRVNQEKFTKAFLQNSIPTGITTLKEGIFVDVSDAFLSMMGRKRTEVIGHTSIEMGFITEKQRDSFSQELNKRGRVENLEMEVKTKGGAPRCGLFNAVMMNINNEKYLLTVMIDITDRRRAEDALRESESHYKRIVSTVPAMLYDYVLYPDGSSRFIYVSNNCHDILELDDMELLSDMNLFWKMIHSDDIERLREEDIAANLAGRTFKAEVRITTKSERMKWVQLSSRPNPAPPGEPAIWSGYVLDITSRKQAEAALEEERLRLQQALDEVRTLRGIVPICSYCKKIRDDKGYWDHVEKYVSAHTDAKFSHGICPACFEREMKGIEASS